MCPEFPILSDKDLFTKIEWLSIVENFWELRWGCAQWINDCGLNLIYCFSDDLNDPMKMEKFESKYFYFSFYAQLWYNNMMQSLHKVISSTYVNRYTTRAVTENLHKSHFLFLAANTAYSTLVGNRFKTLW